MPNFNNIEITIFDENQNEITGVADIDFEVYCGTCGKGLCNQSHGRVSEKRKQPQVVVEACPSCIKEKDSEIERYSDENDKLLDEICDLKEKIENIKDEYEEEISQLKDKIYELENKL